MMSGIEAAKGLGMALVVGLVAVLMFGAGVGAVLQSCIDAHSNSMHQHYYSE